MVRCHNDRCCDEGVEGRQRVFCILSDTGFQCESQCTLTHTWSSYALSHSATMSADSTIQAEDKNTAKIQLNIEELHSSRSRAPDGVKNNWDDLTLLVFLNYGF